VILWSQQLQFGAMGRIRGHYEWDDDDLTPGQKKEGGLHQNLFDGDGNLKGSAWFIPDDGPEPEPLVVTETVYVPVERRRRTREEEELDQAIAELVSHLVGRGIAKAGPSQSDGGGKRLVLLSTPSGPRCLSAARGAGRRRRRLF